MAGSGDTARYEEHKRLFELSDRGCSNVGQTTEMSARSQISLLSSSIEDDKTKSKFKKAREASLHKEGTQRRHFVLFSSNVIPLRVSCLRTGRSEDSGLGSFSWRDLVFSLFSLSVP